MKYSSAVFFFAGALIVSREFICREFIENRLTRQTFCIKPGAIAMHVPQQAPPVFIDRTDVAQIDCLFQMRRTQVCRIPAILERSYTCAAQFPGDPESQMAFGLVCLDSDH